MTQQHKIEGTDNLLMQTIQDQAEDLEHGWREAIQNGIDSPGATEVRLDYDHRHTVVEDDGDGVDLDTESGLALLKNLGETSKKGDGSTIGQFGVGKGQVIAKGHTAWISGDTALHFDVKEWGLVCKTVPVPDDRAVEGLRVVVSHYEDEVPSEGSFRWDSFGSRVEDRFRFAGVATDTDVVVNGEAVSGDHPFDTVAGDHTVEADAPESCSADFVAALEPRSGGDVSVYSRGVYVKDVDGRGLGGVVVTRENLKLNFARNGIQSGCPVWSEIDSWLGSETEALLSNLPDSRLTDGAREFLASRAMSGGELDEEAPVFKTVTGGRASLSELTSRKFSFANGNDDRARRLADGWNMLVLDETDPATSRLKDTIDQVRDAVDLAEEFDVDEKADEVSLPDTHEVLDRSELNSRQRPKLDLAREMAARMGIDREVRWGESSVSESWTDGWDTIVITDGAAPSASRQEWLPSVFRALVRESCSRSDTRGERPSSSSYSRRYQETMEEEWDVLADVIAETRRDGIEGALAGGR